MTLQRAMGAVILAVIFLIITALLLAENKPEEARIVMPVIAEVDEAAVLGETIEVVPATVAQAIEVSPATPPPLQAPEIVAPHETAQQWLLQIATFASQDNAINLVEKLRKLGITASSDVVTTQKGILYRVRTTPQTDKTAVETLGIRIEQVIDIKPQVRRFNG